MAVTTPDSQSPTTAQLAIGGKYRAVAPVARLHLTFLWAVAWAFYFVDLGVYVMERADDFEAWALQPTRLERAIGRVVRKAVGR